MSEINIIIPLWVFRTEGRKVIWTAENYQGSMPDEGEYDPLMLQREDDISPDAHQLFKLDEIALVNNERTAIFGRVPVARDGWFYNALPKWGFKKMAEAAFIKLPLKKESEA
jgi:hypothetical protein